MMGDWGRGGGQDYVEVHQGLATEVLNQPEYLKAAEGLHRDDMGDWAGLGGCVYYLWNLGTAQINANYVARFLGELLADFNLISEAHRISALQEAKKFIAKYKLILHLRPLHTDATLDSRMT